MPDPTDTGPSETPEQTPAASSEPASPASQPSPESTTDSLATLPSMRDALAAMADQRSTLKGETPAETPEPADPSGEPAQPPTAETLKPDADKAPDAAGQQPTGRRAKAAAAKDETIETLREERDRLVRERDAEIEAARKEAAEAATAERTARETAEQEAARIRQEAEATTAEVSKLIGDDAEYHRLANTPWNELTQEENERLGAWQTARKQYSPVARHYQQQYIGQANQRVSEEREKLLGWIASAIPELAKLPAVDPKFFESEDARDLFKQGKHLHEAGARSRDAEVAELKAQLLEAQQTLEAVPHGRLGTLPRAETGGRSAGPASQLPDENASPRELLAFGLEQREQSRRASRRSA